MQRNVDVIDNAATSPETAPGLYLTVRVVTQIVAPLSASHHQTDGQGRGMQEGGKAREKAKEQRPREGADTKHTHKKTKEKRRRNGTPTTTEREQTKTTNGRKPEAAQVKTCE